MWLGRAHSFGYRRQRADLLGFAMLVNAIARFRHRRKLRDAAE